MVCRTARAHTRKHREKRTLSHTHTRTGGYDCWAGNGEPFDCSGGYVSKKTGKTTPYDGKTWEEYRCCDPSTISMAQPLTPTRMLTYALTFIVAIFSYASFLV